MPEPYVPFVLASTDEVVAVVVLILGGLFWLIRRLAETREEAKKESPGLRREPLEQPRPDEEPELSQEEQVRRFFRSLGVEVPQREPPAQPPPAPPPRPARVIPRPSTPKPYTPEPPMPAEAESISTPLAESIARMEMVKSSRTLRQDARAADSEERLALPWLSPLQRAVVLTEILPRRPGPHRAFPR